MLTLGGQIFEQLARNRFTDMPRNTWNGLVPKNKMKQKSFLILRKHLAVAGLLESSRFYFRH